MDWLRRQRPMTDRIACPGLIGRFIDPDATIHDVPPSEVLAQAQRLGGASFDAPGGHYTHTGTGEEQRCTFEVLIDWHQLGGNPALAELARIVHAADTPGALDSHPLAAGLPAIAIAIGVGGLDAESDDQVLLARGSFVHDALNARCLKQTQQPS
jgi:hypothetical protein